MSTTSYERFKGGQGTLIEKLDSAYGQGVDVIRDAAVEFQRSASLDNLDKTAFLNAVLSLGSVVAVGEAEAESTLEYKQRTSFQHVAILSRIAMNASYYLDDAVHGFDESNLTDRKMIAFRPYQDVKDDSKYTMQLLRHYGPVNHIDEFESLASEYYRMHGDSFMSKVLAKSGLRGPEAQQADRENARASLVDHIASLY